MRLAPYPPMECPTRPRLRAIRQRAVVRIDVRHDIVRDEVLKIPRRHGARIHRTVMDGLRIGQNDDHLLCALRERSLQRLRHMDLMRPLLGSNGVAMQRIHHGIAAMRILCIAGRKKDKDVAVDSVAFQIPFK